MPLVRIDARTIRDWNTFHDVFAEALGFPGFYGRNMDAWIDCMSYLDDPDAAMTTVHGAVSDPVVLAIDHVETMPPEIYDELVDCAAFVNWRRLDTGRAAILILAFYRAR